MSTIKNQLRLHVMVRSRRFVRDEICGMYVYYYYSDLILDHSFENHIL